MYWYLESVPEKDSQPAKDKADRRAFLRYNKYLRPLLKGARKYCGIDFYKSARDDFLKMSPINSKIKEKEFIIQTISQFLAEELSLKGVGDPDEFLNAFSRDYNNSPKYGSWNEIPPFQLLEVEPV